jgi:hypothetical protein
MVNSYRQVTGVALAAALLVCAGCNGGGSSAVVPSSGGNAGQIAGLSRSAPLDTDTLAGDTDDEDGGSVLGRLDDLRTIGSTIDPDTGDLNPYGLDIARSDAGKLEVGDLVVCNFNNSANVQGTGTSIIALRPQPGSKPRHILASASLLGCNALALSPGDNIWAAAFAANDNPIVDPNGHLVTTLAGGPWHGPFGQAFSPTPGPFGVAAFYESNASDGSIVRININPPHPFTFDVIATGFDVNHGVPGSILGPSGLQYDVRHDRLYIVDGANNTLVALRHVSTIPAGGIHVTGTTFSGPFRHRARLVFSGAPLNGPISSALLPNGHLVLGNTLDPAGENLMVEITPRGHEVFVKNVDTGAAGALFGMVASGRRGDFDDTRLYFNDDNENTVKVLAP